MGGGSNITGSSNQWTSGNYSGTSTQTPIFPPELKDIELGTAGHLANIQTQLPLEGQYGSMMENPAWTSWNQQFGQYGGLVGPYYTLKSDPNQVVYKLLDDAGAREGYYVGGKGGPEVTAQDVQLINIPQAPRQWVPNPETYVPGTSFLEPSPQQIAPLSELEQLAMQKTPELWNVPEAEQLAMQYASQAGNVPSNLPYYQPGAFESSPYYSSAQNAYQTGVVPTIENQMALSGLGRSSSLADALATGWAGIVPQILSQYSTQYVEPQLGREENALARMSSLVPSLAGMGAQDTNRMLTAINAMMGVGGQARSVEQAAMDAVYADMLRRQALSEEALYTPMGMLFPAAIGQQLVSSGTYNSATSGNTSQRSSGGGLFK